jgi:hypothetical protein
VTFEDPASVGTPETLPPGDSINPAGSPPPEMVNVYGSLPPVAESNCEYGAPRMLLGKLPRTVIVGHATLPLSGMVRDPPSRLVMSSDALFGPTLVG